MGGGRYWGEAVLGGAVLGGGGGVLGGVVLGGGTTVCSR